VWLFWGDKRLPAEERPPIPFAPELVDPTWHAVYVSAAAVSCVCVRVVCAILCVLVCHC
jgi:hypothetical protein